MNVIISNKYQTMLQGLDIDIIKKLDGDVSEGKKLIEEDDDVIIVHLKKDKENIIKANIISQSFIDTIDYQLITNSLTNTKVSLSILESNVSMEEINKTEVVTKAVEKENLASSSDMFETILNYLDENPLLDAIIVYTNDITEIKNVSETLETLPKVESVKYNEGVVSEIIATFEIIEYVRKEILNIPIIVTTGQLQYSEQQKARRAGCRRILSKPYAPEQLKGIADIYLKRE